MAIGKIIDATRRNRPVPLARFAATWATGHSGQTLATSRLAESGRTPWVRRRVVPIAVTVLLGVHAGLLAHAATRHSPTMNEPAHLVAGLAIWKFGRFDVYRVNPPLTRLVAALPVVAVGYEMDWNRFYCGPGARPEFELGADFVDANGERSIWLFTLARWACIPISLIGGMFCFFWGRELYGLPAGLASLALWCFDPNVLANAELVTPDAGAATFGVAAGYTFWRWLKTPTWGRAGAAGVMLGLAQLSKMSWLVLFAVWPVVWVLWQGDRSAWSSGTLRRQIFQITYALVLGLYVLNLGYVFDGSGTRLKNLRFVSQTLAGEEYAGHGGNRFAGSWLGELPVPVPEQYLLGFDTQKRDFEDYGQPSFLRGEWRDRGWWHYYLYACLVKVPHGTQLLASFAAVLAISRAARRAHSAEPQSSEASWRDEVVLLLPAAALFGLVSSQTEFSHHFRYVLPSLGLMIVFLGRPFAYRQPVREVSASGPAGGGTFVARHISTFARPLVAILPLLCLAASVGDGLRIHPHSLAYFNEAAGGPEHGSRHLLGSNLDWGQDLPYVARIAATVEQHFAADVRVLSQVKYDIGDFGLIPLERDVLMRNREARKPCIVFVDKTCGAGGAWEKRELADSVARLGTMIHISGLEAYTFDAFLVGRPQLLNGRHTAARN